MYTSNNRSLPGIICLKHCMKVQPVHRYRQFRIEFPENGKPICLQLQSLAVKCRQSFHAQFQVILVQFIIYLHITTRGQIFQYDNSLAIKSTEVGHVTLWDAIRSIIECHLAVKHLLVQEWTGRHSFHMFK